MQGTSEIKLDWEAICEEAIGHLSALIRIDTTNPPGNERAAVDYLARILTQEGIEFQILEREPGRTNLVARLRGNGDGAPLLLNGHLDVVAAEAEHWEHPPFSAEQADGCIWGRGAIDMKHMVVESLMAMLTAKRSGLGLKRDLIFAAVADEEAGSRNGALFLVEKHPELVRSQYVLNEIGGYTLYFGNARFYPIQVSEKGICWFEMTAKGTPGHGSMPRADNAVVRLSRAVSKLADASLHQRSVPVVQHFLKQLAQASPTPQRQLLPLLLKPHFSKLLLDILRKQNEHQAAGIGAMLRSTVSPTVLRTSSDKVNVVPGRAGAEVDGRTLPGHTTQQFLSEVQRIVGDDISLDVFEQHEGTVFSSETPLYDKLCEVLDRRDPGAVAVPFMIPGFTDSFAYGRLGAICYGFAPVKLEPGIDFTSMYHGHNERIPVDGFKWGVRTLYEVVSEFCA